MNIWFLVVFLGLFMLSLLTIFLSGLVNGLFPKLHPLLHVLFVFTISWIFSAIYIDNNGLFLAGAVVTASYLIPYFIWKLYRYGESHGNQ